MIKQNKIIFLENSVNLDGMHSTIHPCIPQTTPVMAIIGNTTVKVKALKLNFFTLKMHHTPTCTFSFDFSGSTFRDIVHAVSTIEKVLVAHSDRTKFFIYYTSESSENKVKRGKREYIGNKI